MAIKSADQITILDVTDAYSVMLTSEAYTFIGGTGGVGANQSCSTEAVAFCGQNQCASVAVTAGDIVCPTGITAAVSNSGTSKVKITFTTTATVNTACEATIPVVVDGMTMNKKFSFAVARTGNTGATGKGIGCDVVSDFLKTQKDVSGMILNLGGSSVMTYGEKPDGSSWKVALTDPRDTEGDYLGAITLDANQFLSTSGDYEKYFIEDGIRYHHILDPKTGYPVQNGLTSVTIVCDQGYLADGLSTACFVLGLDAAKPLLEKYDAEAVFVDEDKNVYVTSGLMDKFELMKDGYVVNEL